MELHKINKLLNMYFEGETSLSEEKVLKNYFASAEIHESLKKYINLFGIKNQQQKQHSNEELGHQIFNDILKRNDDNKKHKRFLYTSLSIAATLLIVFGIHYFGLIETERYTGTYNDPQLAYLETKKALILISLTMNKGTNEIQKIEKFSNYLNKVSEIGEFNKGLKSAEKFSNFNKYTRIISKKH